MIKPKRWLIAGLSLPLIAMLGWFLYEQSLIWVTPVPYWIAGQGQSSYHFCHSLGNWIVGEVEPVEDTQIARITRAQASDTMERILARYHGFVPLMEANGPRLVRATFPDGQQRLAWYEVVFIKMYDGGLAGEATGVYVDALTGEPLLLIPNVAVGDPCMTCICPAINLPFRLRQCLTLGLCIAYLLSLAIIGGVVWLWRLAAARREAKTYA